MHISWIELKTFANELLESGNASQLLHFQGYNLRLNVVFLSHVTQGTGLKTQKA